MAVTKLLGLLLLLQLRLSLSGQTRSMESVPDLQSSMYMNLDGYPCVRLLNLSGEIGCSNPGRDKVVAPIMKLNSTNTLSQLTTVLLSVDQIETFFARILNDTTFARNVAGVLVESEPDIQNKLKGFSPALKFPQSDFAPYKSINYEWNPTGSGIMWNRYNFPVFLLSQSSTLTLREKLGASKILGCTNFRLETVLAALNNEKNKKSYTADVAEFDSVMQTMKAGTHDSESCLKENSCLPLGGYSVWSSLPPINVSSSEQSKPIILAVASIDSTSIFRDKSPGADSPISGLISLLAAVDALSKLDSVGTFSKQLVFIVFTGEAWGYLGSRRFLLELDLQSDAVSGLDFSLIERVVEIGSIGKVLNQEAKNFFVHTTGNSSATNETLDALRLAQDSVKSEHIGVLSASASNPGIPPSSLMVFLRKNSLVSGVVLEDFDTVFTNKFYHSHLDDLSNINSSAIVVAASLVARTLYILASGDKNISSSALMSINVNVSLVEGLMGCLLDCEPGLSCELVKHYITPLNTCPSNYVGVIIDEPSSTPYLGYVSDVSRFVWNFLAEKTSSSKENASSVCSQDCSKEGKVCIRAETDGKGVCVVSTTRYVPAYSTRLKYESGSWIVLPPNNSDPMGLLDNVWTESNWNTIGLRVYTVQNSSFDNIVLLGSIAITVLSYLAIVVTKAILTKALKRD